MSTPALGELPMPIASGASVLDIEMLTNDWCNDGASRTTWTSCAASSALVRRIEHAWKSSTISDMEMRLTEHEAHHPGKEGTIMRDDVAAIIEHDCTDHAQLANLVAALPDEIALWELMSAYNWGEGFAVPLAVVSHPRCDRALALRMFWELDEAAQLHHGDEETAIRDLYASIAEYDPEGFRALLAYCSTLVEGLREQNFANGGNRFDTGYFNLDDPSLTERQRTLRAAHTKLAQKRFEDAFLRPAL